MADCKVEGCSRVRETLMGYCVMHYKRLKRNGTTDRVLQKYTGLETCLECGELSPRMRKGYCHACSIRLSRKGYAARDRGVKGKGCVNSAGYVVLTVDGKRVYEHRQKVFAQPGEIIHHKDESKINNNVDNLQILSSQSEHMKLHQAVRKNGTIKKED
jgi:hypothetical protein